MKKKFLVTLNAAMDFVITEVFTFYLLWSSPAAVAHSGHKSQVRGSYTNPGSRIMQSLSSTAFSPWASPDTVGNKSE